jgi:hypothetical protein
MNKPAANPSPPGRAHDDPDARLLRWGWLAFAAWTVFGGTWLWQALRAGEAALVGVALTAPLWAAWLLWLLWRGLAALRRALKRSAYGRWHGNYFEFDGRQIRIVFDDDEIFVTAVDVFDALGIEPRRRDPDRVRQLAGRDGLTESPGERMLAFTERGLRSWMERRADAVAVRFGRWFEAEVVEPRRRRVSRHSGEVDAVTERRRAG